jgi:hypothetical protein
MCSPKVPHLIIIDLMTLLSSKIKHFYTNRNYFNDAKTHIEPYLLNEWLYMSDFSVCILVVGEVGHFWVRGNNGQGFFHVKHIRIFFLNYQIRVLRLPYTISAQSMTHFLASHEKI